MNILFLEDDFTLSQEIKDFLVAKGIECDTVFDGDLFFRQYKKQHYDVFLLDINVPKMNGLDVCRKIREADQNTPIIMLTAYGELDDKIDAFGSGADDYLVKPFHLEELYARIKVILRRKDTLQAENNIITVGDLFMNIDEKLVKRADSTISLTAKEFKLLCILAEAKGRIVSKQTIADSLWDYHVETNQNTIEVYINFLRNKIDKGHENKLIHTKIGFGYYLRAE
ncbi:DNA-binding response regulator, OmpR family, contains REC and winged-helix (wHTH) domain [Flexibacter flexilis DSM 6793]|uniref:DNA-binding response regulator, OmpR family, contains REC and winged-helix (WHTH) domain n=1 Tax=Flexibacter flexilis DSM 6793 TaxID=927664 RepID=A0A1I1E490_9BACT|nr:response regulator transcription factor [Flexibacter flexilis]SFB81897.1 DNA-binding response regulator, OmpR family, contains REC and winged-helix (wHTH) domain [Flexibacter flexilis DSM 6793]